METAVTERPKLKMHPSIQLASGDYFDFLNPESTPLSIWDIATGLSRICRFTGHLRDPEIATYTVAQHCVLASENGEGDAYEKLMHDRAESVIGDVSSPLKQLLPEYKRIEDHIEAVTAVQFNLPHPMSASCKVMDLRMLATEKRDLMPCDKDGDYWSLLRDIAPLPFTIIPWEPAEARARFLHRYNYLAFGYVPDEDEPFAQPHANAPAEYVDACYAAWGR